MTVIIPVGALGARLRHRWGWRVAHLGAAGYYATETVRMVLWGDPPDLIPAILLFAWVGVTCIRMALSREVRGGMTVE